MAHSYESTSELTVVNEGIRVTVARHCYLCKRAGTLVWAGLRDRLYSAPGEWSLRRCKACGLVWLDPMADPDDLHTLYATYYTHGQSSSEPNWGRLEPWVSGYLGVRYGYSTNARLRGWLLSCTPWADEVIGGVVRWLPAHPGGRLLDVGCGNGEFLGKMRDRGWRVVGVEPDAEAAAIARSRYALDVGDWLRAGPESDTFDAVTAHHVIEHTLDPVAFLNDLARVTRPGGCVVLVTPNAYGLGATLFRSYWVHWDPPRHLFLFSTRCVSELVDRSGLVTERLFTTGRYARFAWAASRSIATGPSRRGEQGKPKGLRRAGSLAFQGVEHLLGLAWPRAGEEIVVLARKPEAS